MNLGDRPDIRMRPGMKVTVKSPEEIAATLDENGTLDGLPFTEEMWKYCGHTLEIAARVNRMMVEGTGFRRVRNAIIPKNVFCDGKGHDNCMRRCRLIFRDGWLRPASPDAEVTYPAGTDKNCYRAAYIDACHGQSSALTPASYPLAGWQQAEYWLLKHVRASVRWGRTCMKLILGSKKTVIAQKDKTLGPELQTGDLVEVKSREEIMATLDSAGKNRGLEFSDHMYKFSGERFRVASCLGRYVDEKTSTAKKLTNTVLLEGAFCRHEWCPRLCYWLWRNCWLRKIDDNAS